MPGRILPLVTNEIYHIYNRGIDRRPTFTTIREYQRAIEAIKFYRFTRPPLRLSKFLRLEEEGKSEVLQLLQKKDKLIRILCYCLMPNHFHLLLKQDRDKGIAKFLSNVQNSYTRYFNTRHDRDGSLFLNQFKAVRIETDEQLLHVCRYIHLNPYTGFVVKSLAELEKYPWSSLPDYISRDATTFVERDMILGYFRNTDQYKRFVFDQADYQRRLREIKHLIFE
jgi:putative transposase